MDHASKLKSSVSHSSLNGSSPPEWVLTEKRKLLLWVAFHCAVILYLLCSWYIRGHPYSDRHVQLLPSASSVPSLAQRNTLGMESVDPYIRKKFSREDICERKRYPAGESLRADKVTILVNGFAESRIELLQKNMWEYAESPLVDAIYVLWGNVSSPQALVEDHMGWKEPPLGAGVQGAAPHAQIHVVRQPSQSLNDRFLPRPFIRTRAVIICDDDITVDLNVLEFALHVWGENEKRIVGFFPRAHKYSLEQKAWLYTKLPDRYSIVLTKFMLLHTDYLFEYTCHTPRGVKEYVDFGANCEDIAMNFVVSQRTMLGPMLVAGSPRDWGDTRNSEKDLAAVGLSARTGHKKDRGACITEFQRLWGGMELRYSYSKAVPDVSEQVLCEKFGYMVHCDHRANSRVQAQRALGMHIVRQEKHYAYCTLVASADLLPAAIAFAQSLRLTGSVHDLVLMVDEVAGSEINLQDKVLLQHFDHVKRVATVKNRYGVKGFSKLNAWLLEEYSKVVYIDVDTLVLGNLDHLFEHPEPTAVPDVYMSGRFNSGLLVLKPSRVTYDAMMTKMDTLQSYNKGDQGFLNAFFSGWFQMPPEHRLPARYNAVIFFPDHYHPPAWFNIDKVHEVMGPIQMVHFANPWFKPWRLEAAGNYSLAFLGKGASKSTSQGFEYEMGEGGVHGDEEGEKGGVTVLGESGSRDRIETPPPVNIWCSLWIRLAKELEANKWMPLDPSNFSLTALLPNPGDYKGQDFLLSPGGPAQSSEHVVDSSFAPASTLLFSTSSGNTSTGVGIPGAIHTPIEPPEPAYIGREAFVTLVTKHNYFAAPVWATSYLQHHTFNSWRKTILLVLSTVPRDSWRPYRRLFNYVKVVDPIIVGGRQLDDSFAILHAWDQRSFQKLVYVDPVSLFTDNCNELLNYHPFAAVPSVFPPDMFSSKVMVLQPNSTTFADMMLKLKTLSYPQDSFDRFLNSYYHGWFRESPLHRITPNFGVDMWFKEGLMKFFVPWKILVFDPRATPWSDISDWMAHDRTKAVKLWRRTFCSLEDPMKPPELEYMCKDLTT